MLVFGTISQGRLKAIITIILKIKLKEEDMNFTPLRDKRSKKSKSEIGLF
jgi:hypothetical protein